MHSSASPITSSAADAMLSATARLVTSSFPAEQVAPAPVIDDRGDAGRSYGNAAAPEAHRMGAAVRDDDPHVHPALLFYRSPDPDSTQVRVGRQGRHAPGRGVRGVHPGIREESPSLHAEEKPRYAPDNRIALPQDDFHGAGVHAVLLPEFFRPRGGRDCREVDDIGLRCRNGCLGKDEDVSLLKPAARTLRCFKNACCNGIAAADEPRGKPEHLK